MVQKLAAMRMGGYPADEICKAKKLTSNLKIRPLLDAGFSGREIRETKDFNEVFMKPESECYIGQLAREMERETYDD